MKQTKMCIRDRENGVPVGHNSIVGKSREILASELLAGLVDAESRTADGVHMRTSFLSTK